MAILGPLLATTGTAKSGEDTMAFLSLTDADERVTGAEIGAVEFCMGGGMAIAAAGNCPDRISAVASFYGGGLVTDAPDTPPHLYAPNLKA